MTKVIIEKNFNEGKIKTFPDRWKLKKSLSVELFSRNLEIPSRRRMMIPNVN